LTTPYYLLEEEKLRRNLALIRDVADRSGDEIILAFKAFALWKTFPIFREYISATTASSPDEARLALEEFGAPAHTYSPAYTEHDFPEILRCSSHITFNSLSQFHRFKPTPALSVREGQWGGAPSLGLRVNPEYSEIETELYNPCAPGSRFGVLAEDLPAELPSALEGFHIHCHCESSAENFARTLVHIEEKFSRWFPQLKWINFGGGHLMTCKDYNVELLVETLRGFHARYPHLRMILEPGSAFAWQTGPLVASVVDVVENHGIRTAILDVSFTCHMPDCLEMPYQPEVRGAAMGDEGPYVYRLGGNSCLSGDYMGDWSFDHELQVGDEIVFEDMIHYTTVKTTTFNGVHHPSLAIRRLDGTIDVLREYRYEDYRDRMD
jgi:carboxynorspermidine decarboxylase